jgi:hypothetical protein
VPRESHLNPMTVVYVTENRNQTQA